MSLYSALSAGVSGLAAQANALAAISDNIVNINTTGYKGSDTSFKTLVGGGGSRGYSAGGVIAINKSTISQQGLIQASASATDMAVDGQGFFVVSGEPDSNDVYLTRAGSFRPDPSGYLRNDAGFYLRGWEMDATGNYAGGVDSLEAIRVSDVTGTAEATSRIGIRANLTGRQTAYVGPPAYAAGSMASGAITPHFARPVDVYDSQGNIHRVSMAFLKTGPNAWQAEIYAPPGETSAPGGLLVSGTVAFNPDGSLDIPGSSPALFAPINLGNAAPAFVWTNGAGAVPITLDLGTNGGVDGITQFGSDSALISSDINGAILGSVASVNVSKDGVLSVIFDNGTIRNLYQLPLATVPNPDGLLKQQGNIFTASAQSGNIAINTPGDAGGGSIAASALEASNVDLAEQFTKMITTQRAYSASAKIITTSDEMLQELGALKR